MTEDRNTPAKRMTGDRPRRRDIALTASIGVVVMLVLAVAGELSGGAFLGGVLQEAPWNNEWFVGQGRKDLIHDMRIVEAHLGANGPYVTGDRFTLADIPMGLVVNRWFKVEGFDKPETPNLAAYYELLSARPAYLAHGRNGLP